MNMTLSLYEWETFTDVSCMMSVSFTGRISQFGACMIEELNNKLFELFTQNFSNLMSHGNEEASSSSILAEAEPLKSPLTCWFSYFV